MGHLTLLISALLRSRKNSVQGMSACFRNLFSILTICDLVTSLYSYVLGGSSPKIFATTLNFELQFGEKSKIKNPYCRLVASSYACTTNDDLPGNAWEANVLTCDTSRGLLVRKKRCVLRLSIRKAGLKRLCRTRKKDTL